MQGHYVTVRIPIRFGDTIREERLPNEKFCHRTVVPLRLNAIRGCRDRMRSCRKDNVSLPRPGSDGPAGACRTYCAGNVGHATNESCRFVFDLTRMRTRMLHTHGEISSQSLGWSISTEVTNVLIGLCF
jgi:hypothetical protein